MKRWTALGDVATRILLSVLVVGLWCLLMVLVALS